MPPEPLFWLHFFRARPTTFSVASKRTREHAKGHAMLRMYAPESPVAKTWSDERVSRSFRFLLRSRNYYTLHHTETTFINREMACWCYAGCSCWRTHSQKKISREAAAACELQFCAFLPPDWWCWVQNSILSPKSRLMLSQQKIG